MQKYKVYNKDGKILLIDNWKEFCNKFIIIEAAGGVVYNNEDQVLMIFRNDFWDLPKGKLEKNETLGECALREVEEETGVKELILSSKISKTYHTYSLNNSSILKCTHWFKMFTKYKGKLNPQIDEGISKALWVNKNNILDIKKKMFPNIKDLL